MTERVTVRVGPESAVLVLGTGRDRLRETAGILGEGLLSALGWQVLLLQLGSAVGVFAHLMLHLDGAAVIWAVAAVSAVEIVVGTLHYDWETLTRPGRLEFSPPHEPTHWRQVLLGRPSRWYPVTGLRGLKVAHWVYEPVDGDPRPRLETYSVRNEAPGFSAVPLSAREVRGDPRQLVEDLRALLGPVGLAVELDTERFVWAPGRIPSYRLAPPEAVPPEAVPPEAVPPEGAPPVADAVPADAGPERPADRTPGVEPDDAPA
ncbi:hypothetical protein [Kitasatospora sp. NBC_00458]|uniref:hypothetical protein n=1 Tax=Kitasatospora sp. NBC_00458 TaxID=2903568 RepID=UPI002E1892AB